MAISALFAFTVSTAVFAEETPTLDTTALSLVLADNPLADFTDLAVQQAVAARKTEVSALFDAVLTDQGKQEFLQYTPFVLGEIIAEFDAPTTAKLKELLAGQTSLPVGADGVGIAALDAVLKKNGVKEIENPFSSDFIFKFDPKRNPNLVAADFKELAALKFAEANGFMSFGGRGLERFAGFPAVYVLTVGWGDCESGCIDRHRLYFEVAGAHVTKIGETGTELSAEDRAALFKN